MACSHGRLFLLRSPRVSWAVLLCRATPGWSLLGLRQSVAGVGRPRLAWACHMASSTPGGSVNKAPGFWRPRLSLLPQSAGQSKSPGQPRSRKSRPPPSRAGRPCRVAAGGRDGGRGRTGASFAVCLPRVPPPGCLASPGCPPLLPGSLSCPLPPRHACPQSCFFLVPRLLCRMTLKEDFSGLFPGGRDAVSLAGLNLH